MDEGRALNSITICQVLVTELNDCLGKLQLAVLKNHQHDAVSAMDTMSVKVKALKAQIERLNH